MAPVDQTAFASCCVPKRRERTCCGDPVREVASVTPRSSRPVAKRASRREAFPVRGFGQSEPHSRSVCPDGISPDGAPIRRVTRKRLSGGPARAIVCFVAETECFSRRCRFRRPTNNLGTLVPSTCAKRVRADSRAALRCGQISARLQSVRLPILTDARPLNWCPLPGCVPSMSSSWAGAVPRRQGRRTYASSGSYRGRFEMSAVERLFQLDFTPAGGPRKMPTA